jgi:hypothetical protein
MADTYTTSLRLQLQTTGGNSGTWGTIANTQYQLLQDAITGDNGYAGGSGGINIAALAAYTLTVNQGTSDEARQQLYPFVGALVVDCEVTLPGVVKIGWAYNATTGGKNVILKVGGGTTLTLPAGSGWTLFYCDGTNVTTPAVTFGTFSPTTLTVSGGILAVTGAAATVRRMQLQTASVARWQIDANATAESGANAGSDLEVWSYTDGGAQLSKVLSIVRSTAAVTVLGAVTMSSTLRVNGAVTFDTGLTVAAGGITVTLGGLTVAAGGMTVTGNSTITGTLAVSSTLTAANGTSGTQVVNYSQFPATIVGSAVSLKTPAGRVQGGSGMSGGGGNVTITFPESFASACYSVVVSLNSGAPNTYRVDVSSSSTASFVAYTTVAGVGTSGIGFNYIAIGV